MKTSDMDRERLQSIHNGCMAARERRDITPNTRAIYQVLARRTQEALNEQRTCYDKTALLRDLDEIEAIHSYVEKRNEDQPRLESDEHFARMGDYAVVFCQSLKDVEGTVFQKMYWIDIVNQLDQEL